MRKLNIVLIGFMGTGKSTIGRIVSEKLGYKYVDTDDMIEKRCGLSIEDIFKVKGEAYFREVESQVVQEVSMLERAVISCGGGVVKNKYNIEKLKLSGIVICLKTDPDTLYKRLKYGKKMRPLVYGKSKDHVLNLLNSREHLYSAADVSIDTSNQSPLYSANKVISIYRTLSG